MGQIGHQCPHHRDDLGRKHDLGYQRGFFQQQPRRFADGIGKGEPGHIADDHEDDKAGLTKFLRAADTEHKPEHEGIGNDLYNRSQKQPEEATDRSRKLTKKILFGEIVKESVVANGRQYPLT